MPKLVKGMPLSRSCRPAAAAAIMLLLAACASGSGGTPGSSPAQPAGSTPSQAAGSTPGQAAPHSSAPAQPAGTQVIRYQPWTSAGTLASGITATATRSGSCFTNSGATTAPRAWRCLASNALYDPCFSPEGAGAGRVSCPDPADPDSVTVLNLTSPLPAPPAATGSPELPWLLVLANGQHCLMNTGTVGMAGGKNEYFLCAEGGAYGLPDRSSSTWTITYAPTPAAAVMIKEGVTKAYE